MAKIETGVDKLVELVNQHKRISIDDAAKKLGVSKVVIQEWADFLEEEKVVSIEYKFSKTMIVERKLSDKEIKQKVVEFGSQKDAFIRKVESSIRTLDTETTGLEKIKKEFDSLKKEIGSEISKVKSEVEELEKYEGLKKNLDKDIERQQKSYKDQIGKINLEIKVAEKSYGNLLQDINSERDMIKAKEQRLKDLQKKEKALQDGEADLKQRLKAIYELAQSIQQKIDEEGKSIEVEEGHLENLERLSDKVEKEIIEKRKGIDPLIAQTKEHEKKINQIQERIYDKVKERTAQIRSQIAEGESVMSRFRKFFTTKSEIERLFQKIETDRESLKQELNDLTRKALAFEVIKKSADVKKHIKELEAEFDRIDKKKKAFKAEIDKLVKLIKG